MHSPSPQSQGSVGDSVVLSVVVSVVVVSVVVQTHSQVSSSTAELSSTIYLPSLKAA